MISETQTTEAPAPAATETPDGFLHGAARAAAIAGMRALLDLLEADPALPLDEYAFRFNLYPRNAGIAEDDTPGSVQWIGMVAGALGTDVTDNLGGEPTSATDSYMAQRSFGDHVQYRAIHLTPEFTARVQARQAATGGAA